jgi:hypothetical protein
MLMFELINKKKEKTQNNAGFGVACRFARRNVCLGYA